MFLLFFIIFLSTSFVNCDEIIGLKNKTHIVCATNTESPIYISPPIPQKPTSTSLLLENDKLWKDAWLLKNSEDLKLKKVLDKRWEDFGIIYTDRIYFKSVISLSFSQYGSTHMRIISHDVDKNVTRKKRDVRNYWSHYGIWTPDKDVNASLDAHNQLVKKAKSWQPFHLTAETDEKSYLRIHSYKLRWADTISQEPSTIIVSPNDTSCFMLYMYLCPHCSLEVYVSGSYNSFHGRPRIGDSLPKWKTLKITVDSELELKLVRNTTNGEQEGQWGIDIRQCSRTVSNKAIYDVILENADGEVDRFCSTLEYSSNSNQNRIFNCEPGILGQKCDLKCEDLLGSENKYCQKRQICDSSFTKSECFCAWGYEGNSCDVSCSTGRWGLSCRNKCNNCVSCNQHTGACGNNTPSSFFKKGIGTMILGIGIICVLF